jgi:hypothetical protein
VSESAVGLIVLGAICFACSITAHLLVPSFWLAVVVTMVASVSLFQFAAYLHIGFLDPFWPIAVVTTSVFSFMASVGIGAVVRRIRQVRASQ